MCFTPISALAARPSMPLVGYGLGDEAGSRFALTHPDRAEQVLTTNVPLVSQHIGRALSGVGGGVNPTKAILGRRLKAYEEVDTEAATTAGGAVVSSIRLFVDQDLVVGRAARAF